MQGTLINRGVHSRTVTIAQSATASSAIEIGGAAWGSFSVPAALTGTTIDVQISNDGTNFTSVQEEGNETNPITVTTSAVNTYPLPMKTCCAKYLRLVSGSSEGAARTLTVFLKG